MKTISVIAAGLLGAIALSAYGAEAVRDLPLDFSNVDVTKNTKWRFGAPHIAVNPKDPNNIVVLASSKIGYTKECLPPKPGSDCETVALRGPGMPPLQQPRGFAKTKGFMDIGVFVSFDRGKTFKEIELGHLVPPDDPMVRARGEGPIATTPEGHFYIGFNALDWGNWESTPQTFFPNGGVGVIKSTDGGLTWKWTSFSGTPADWPYGGADLTTGTFYVTSGIAGLTPLGPRSTGKEDSPIGKISDRWISSTNDGTKWTDPQPLGGFDGPKHVGAGHSSVAAAYGIMATMFVVPSQTNCAFFVGKDAPANCVVFQTSTDAGKTWSRSRVPTPAEFRTAPLALFVSADPTKKNHFTATLMNASGADFLVFRTPDGGKTWSGPVRITQDSSKTHFAPYVAMSPKGEFGLMWRTQEPDPSKPRATDASASREPMAAMGRGPSVPFSVWAIVSSDGGATFSKPIKVSKANSPAPPEDPNDAFRIVGDHGPSGMAIDGSGGVHVVWADWTPGERAIYLATLNIKSFTK